MNIRTAVKARLSGDYAMPKATDGSECDEVACQFAHWCHFEPP